MRRHAHGLPRTALLSLALSVGCRPGDDPAPEDTAGDSPSETADASDSSDASDASDASDSAPPDSDSAPADPPDLALGESIFRGQCAACHTLGRGDTTRGPDLLVRDLRPDNWLRHWLEDPAAMLAWNGHAQSIVDEWDGRVMPDPDLDAAQIEAVIAYLGARRAAGQAVEPLAPQLLDTAELEATTALYFDRCAGCHGARRAGAIGPDLRPERATLLGTDLLTATVRHGTPWGMAGFGAAGELSEDEIGRLAAFLQLPVPDPPPFTLDDARTAWRVHVPVADRPTAPEHGLDPSAWIGVVERDTGRVALLDGTTRAEIGRVDVGRATHILRTSADGRHLVAVGRDGQVHLVDLWFNPPQVVAEARGCHDARSVEGSKFPGFENRYIIEGCYGPSQYVVFDGLTLEPLVARSVLGPPVGGGAPLEEVRVAAIVASPFEPSWVLALKESGHVAFVDYAQPDFPLTERLDGALLLHDGGWDATRRYFIAASATGQMVVTDVRERAVVARIPTGALPHPGRGANWVDPVYGPVNATVHLGEPTLLVYGADPADRPEHAWTEVRRVTLPSAGSLFLKTHPVSPWVLVDMAMSEDPALARQVCAYEKASGALNRCFDVGDRGRAVHIEFNADGSQFWVSLWHFDGEIVAYDTLTLQEVGRVGDLRSPTGKFNVYNTAHDVY